MERASVGEKEPGQGKVFTHDRMNPGVNVSDRSIR